MKKKERKTWLQPVFSIYQSLLKVLFALYTNFQLIFILSSCWMFCSLYVTPNCWFSLLDHTKKLHSLFGHFEHPQKIFLYFFSSLHLFSGIVSLQLQVFVVVVMNILDSLLITVIETNLMKLAPEIWWNLFSVLASLSWKERKTAFLTEIWLHLFFSLFYNTQVAFIRVCL